MKIYIYKGHRGYTVVKRLNQNVTHCSDSTEDIATDAVHEEMSSIIVFLVEGEGVEDDAVEEEPVEKAKKRKQKRMQRKEKGNRKFSSSPSKVILTTTREK